MSEVPGRDVEIAVSPEISPKLLRWYRRARRDLPWRQHSDRPPDPYRVWVSEVMLQQTRVETVIPYYERFLARFPTLADLAASDVDDVLALWSGLGYYRRARYLHRGARHVIEHHGGEFPRRLADALEVPGVGRYSAAAILSIAYGVNAAVVDGNVERVLARVLRLTGDPKRGATARRLRAVADELVPSRAPGDFNQAVMELGATICTPRGPRCDECPLESLCESARRSDAESFPQLAPRRAPIPVTLQVGVICRRGRYLLERVSGHTFLDGLWMFPFVEAGDATALADHLAQKLGTKFLGSKSSLKPVRHSITFRRITAQPVVLEAAPDLSTRNRRSFRWAALSELGDRIAVSSLALKIRRAIEAPPES